VERAFRPRLGPPARSEEPPQEPGHVHIEERLSSPVHDGQHCARRVGADPRQALQFGPRAGNDATVLFDGLRQVLEGQRLLPPEPKWPERAFEAIQGGVRERSPRRVALDEPGARVTAVAVVLCSRISATTTS
jgi:hypothetical protein